MGTTDIVMEKRALIYLPLTLMLEIGLGWFVLDVDSNTQGVLQVVNPAEWLFPYLFTFNILVLPFLLLSVSKKSSPMIQQIRNGENTKLHLAAFRYPVGTFLSMGFCIPAIIADPLNGGPWYAVAVALLPVAIVFFATVVFGRRFDYIWDMLVAWTFHWTGRLIISLAVVIYLLFMIVSMKALIYVADGPLYPVATLLIAYVPLRIYLLYYGRGSVPGLVLVLAGIVFQQLVLWTDLL